MPSPALAGIDGCRGGWMLVKHSGGKYFATFHTSITSIFELNTDIALALIDIPIGLSSAQNKRTLDSTFRRMLSANKSSVFNAPCREAVYAHSFEKAREANIEVEGKSLSVQSLNIMKKIREVDEYIIKNSNSSVELMESHPEFAFMCLSPSKKMLQTKKSTKEGIQERLQLLSQWEKSFTNLYETALAATKRTQVKPDDILDAMCLCLCNVLAHSSHRLAIVQDEHKVDSKGIEMKVGYLELCAESH